MSEIGVKKAPTYSELEGLRGWMAIWVFVSHVSTMAGFQFYKDVGWGKLLANGSMAVGAFIMISGFVIALSLDKKPGLVEFFVRRGLRIFPVYLVCLLLSVLVLNMSLEFLHNMPWDAPRRLDRIKYLQDSVDHFWTHLSLHALLLHGLVPDSVLPSTSYAFMGQAWSLTLEWQFYLAAPLLYWSVRRRSFAIHALVLLVFVALSQYFRQSSFLLSYLWLFYAGVLFQLVLASEDERTRWSLLTVCALAFAVAAWRGQLLVSFVLFFVALASGASALPAPIQAMIRASLCNRLSLWLGSVSYGFYCVHMVAIFVCASFIVNVLKVEDQLSYAALLIPMSLAVALGASQLLAVSVERPCIQLGKRIVIWRSQRAAAAV